MLVHLIFSGYEYECVGAREKEWERERSYMEV